MTDSAAVPTYPTTSPAVLLDAEVARQLRKGWTLASRSETQAVLTRKRRLSVFWNVVLTLLTGGLWLIVVAIRLANRTPESRTVTVDPSTGRVSVR